MAANRVDELIQRIMDVTGIHSQSELARELGINRSGITHARHRNQVPDKWVMALYRRFGLNPGWVESGVGRAFLNSHAAQDTGFKYVPKVAARLSAGSGSFECESEVNEYLAFSKAWLRRKGSADHMVAMEVFGNSMEPVIREGDTVLIDRSRTRILAGAIYAVGVEDTILVKRLEKHPERLVLCSDNKDFSPIYLEKDECDKVRILGKVIWSCREYH